MSEHMTRDMLIRHVAKRLNKQLNYHGFDHDPSWLWNYMTTKEMHKRYLAVAKDLVDTIQNWFDGKEFS